MMTIEEENQEERPVPSEEEYREAVKFHYIVVGQSWFLGFILAILLTEAVPALNDIGIIVGLLLVYISAKVFHFALGMLNYEHYKECIDIINAYWRDKLQR